MNERKFDRRAFTYSAIIAGSALFSGYEIGRLVADPDLEYETDPTPIPIEQTPYSYDLLYGKYPFRVLASFPHASFQSNPQIDMLAQRFSQYPTQDIYVDEKDPTTSTDPLRMDTQSRVMVSEDRLIHADSAMAQSYFFSESVLYGIYNNITENSPGQEDKKEFDDIFEGLHRERKSDNKFGTDGILRFPASMLNESLTVIKDPFDVPIPATSGQYFAQLVTMLSLLGKETSIEFFKNTLDLSMTQKDIIRIFSKQAVGMLFQQNPDQEQLERTFPHYHYLENARILPRKGSNWREDEESYLPSSIDY